jgi:hypothetical protein
MAPEGESRFAGSVATETRGIDSVPKVSENSVVVGELQLVARDHAEQLAMGRMPCPSRSWPRREYIVEPSIGVQRDCR